MQLSSVLFVCAVIVLAVNATPEVCGDGVKTNSSQTSLNSTKPSVKGWEHQLCNFFVCITKVAVGGGQWGMTEILTCLNGGVAPRGEGNSIQFNIRNGESAKNDGLITNAVLTWGKWRVNGVDATSVNGMKFSHNETTSFTAMGRENSPSGAEGSFDIIENSSDLAATVSFVVPFIGTDRIDIKNAEGGAYVCTPRQSFRKGPLSYDIICHKINTD